jgi:enterochelin esterase-like enzyme
MKNNLYIELEKYESGHTYYIWRQYVTQRFITLIFAAYKDLIRENF